MKEGGEAHFLREAAFARIRNSKHEIRNKIRNLKFEIRSKSFVALRFRISDSFRISKFEIRI